MGRGGTADGGGMPGAGSTFKQTFPPRELVCVIWSSAAFLENCPTWDRAPNPFKVSLAPTTTTTFWDLWAHFKFHHRIAGIAATQLPDAPTGPDHFPRACGGHWRRCQRTPRHDWASCWGPQGEIAPESLCCFSWAAEDILCE